VSNDISPYLQRPVRTLEEAMAEAQQQRLEQALTAATGPVVKRSKGRDTPAAPAGHSSAGLT
jgi:hypothetical protein